MSRKANGRTLESYSYTYDNNGNQLTKKENGKTTTYVYDKLNRLTKENMATYTYDNARNRLSKSDGTDNVTYSYDQRNMLTQKSKNGIITTYKYDKNGNLTAESDGTQYTYDAFNQLVETDKQDGTWQQNVYDATGLRMATVENGTYTGYTFDRDNIIAEYNKDDSMTTRYIRGYDLISQKKDTGETYNYLHNAHGDTTKLVDTAGKVQNSYSYDAFGNTTTYAEKVGNQFRYAGEQYDSITGEYYLRARYYDPAMGRFMNEDTYKGQIENPQSMNLYAYCVNNPIIYTDPSGHNPTKCSSGQGTGNGFKDKTRDLAEYYIANPVAVNITQHPSKFTEKLFDILGFKRIDGIYHARQDALQQYGGYNFLYDIVFDYATSMKAKPFEFTYNGQDYRFWAWKGDYLNLGAGAELGLYKRLSVYGIPTPHWLVDTSLALPMSLTLRDNRGHLIASYHPSEPQWWITAFNPYRQDVNAKDLRVTYTIDFSGNKKSRGMFKAFYKRWYGQTSQLTFDKKKYKATLRF